MMGSMKMLLAASAVAAMPGLASAAILDFTKDGSLTGTFRGIGYTVTGAPYAANQNQEFDGDASDVLAPLALENDGIGIGAGRGTSPDEIAFAELLTITFDSAVKLTGAYFLDLFEAQGGDSEEVAIITGDGVAGELTFDAFQVYPGTGYAEGTFENALFGTVFTFTAAPTNDGVAEPDYALAGLQIAPIPLPAGALLLGTGLAAFGAAKRRKKA